MQFVEWLGYTAGAITALCQVPQVVKMVRERSAQDVSLKTAVALSIGLSLWIWFGLMRGDLPVIIANTIGFCLAVLIVGLRIKYG